MPRYQFISPTGDGSCVSNATAVAILYLYLRAKEGDRSAYQLVSNASFMGLATRLNDGAVIRSVEVACDVVLGSEEESFDEKEKRVSNEIKLEVDESTGVFAEIAENVLSQIEMEMMTLSDGLIIEMTRQDLDYGAEFEALAEYFNSDMHSAENPVPYVAFDLDREQVCTALAKAFRVGDAWLPDGMIRTYIEYFQGDFKSQSFLDGSVVVRGGEGPGFAHLDDPLHTYVRLPFNDRCTKKILDWGADPAPTPGLGSDDDNTMDDENTMDDVGFSPVSVGYASAAPAPGPLADNDLESGCRGAAASACGASFFGDISSSSRPSRGCAGLSAFQSPLMIEQHEGSFMPASDSDLQLVVAGCTHFASAVRDKETIDLEWLAASHILRA